MAQLPEAVAAGHCASGGAPAPRQVQLRVDAAGCSTQIAQACRQRNIEFFMTARSNDEVTTAIDHNRFDRDTWQPALADSDGEPSERAQVRASSTEFVDLEGWPERTRFIARREPLHPGAQRTLFDSELWRYRGFYTDGRRRPRRARRPHASPRTNREQPSPRSKTPASHALRDFDTNAAWTQLVALSPLVQQLRLRGPLLKPPPQRLRWQLWHAPARIVRSSRKWTLRLLRLVARHSATAARLQPRRPIDPATARRPQPRQNSMHQAVTPRHPDPRPTKVSPNKTAQPQHAPPTQPNQQTRHPKSYEKTQTRVGPLTNSRERSGLAVSRERGAITRLKRVRNFTATRDRPEPSRFGEWSR